MDFYIYTHRDSQGNLLYVGKGRGDRDVEQNRSDLWKEGISNPFMVDRICEGLDEDLALFVEMSIIRALNPPLNIKKRQKVITPLDYKRNPIDILEPTEEEKLSYKKIEKLKKKLIKNQLTDEELLIIKSGELTTNNAFLTEEQIKLKSSIAKKLKVKRKCEEKLLLT